MEWGGLRAEALALLLVIATCVQGDFVDPPEPVTSLYSAADAPTRFPCQYEVEPEEKVVQVTWYKVLPGGQKDYIIAAHFTEGQTDYVKYSRRVRFESGNPTENSALLLLSTKESDEGTYICTISVFPSGNFQREIALNVWILPISSVDSEPLMEGQQFGVVASCRAVGRPLPKLSWDTDLPGRVQNRTSDTGAVSSLFSLHPLRSMNGKRLDCLVWHPGLKEPRRIENRLVVHYPPAATISSSPERLYVGLKGAELVCHGKGSPQPETVAWRWRGGALPAGVSEKGGKLIFERALQLNDSGSYECELKNSVGIGKTEYQLEVTEKSGRIWETSDDNLMLIVIIGIAAGVVVMVLVIVVVLISRRNRRKTKRLKRALSEKTVEINTLSRQASFRGLASVGSEYRGQGRSIYKGSQSTLGGRWPNAEEVELDELGRPMIWEDGGVRGAERSVAKEEHNARMELFMKSSNMSLDSGLPSSLIPLKPQQDDGCKDPGPGLVQEGDPPPEDDSVVEEREDEDDGGSYQITNALNNHFYYSKGFLRPKPDSNAVLLHPSKIII
ncbi:unnamed protein product [Menidia menidia]|uniref:(Atlantic silverside) hypothetical protein n=1 Tax=Menidia menidia TaxID=238744 RepID=A0A8S4APV3_9TELE|nr:unnamed protein product [Menidia menidia]